MNATLRQGFNDARQVLGRRTLGVVAAAAFACVGVAMVLETPGASGGVAGAGEPSLIAAATFGVVIPLVSYGMVGRASGGLDALMTAARARYGASRRTYALGRLSFILAVAAAIAAASALWALLGSFAAGGEAQWPGGTLGEQITLTLALAVVGACSYGACFALAQLLGGNTGRVLYLAGDWLWGSGVGVAAVPWPRGHLRAVLGGPSVLGMSNLQSLQLLIALGAFGALLYARRVPR